MSNFLGSDQIDGEIFYPGTSKEKYEERQSGIHDAADWAWRWSKAKFDFGLKNGFVVVKESRSGKRIYTKTYQKASIEENDNGYYIEYGDRTKSLSTLELTDNKYSNDNATKDVSKTIGKKIFEHTKPVEMISLLVNLCTRNGDIILDFFPGSATTAEAVMRMDVNSPEIKRHWIMVQMPELCTEGTTAYKEGYRTICDIGKKRIELTRNLLLKEYPDTSADLGFKHYTLYEPSKETLDKLENFSPEQMFSNLLDEFGVPTVLTTWLVRDGYGFNAKYEKIDFSGYTAYFCGKHLYLIHEGLTDDAIMAICERLECDAEFNPENIVLFGYSFTWGMRDTLKINVNRIKDTDKNLCVNFDVRY